MADYSKIVVSLSRGVAPGVVKNITCQSDGTNTGGYPYFELGNTLEQANIVLDGYNTSLSRIEYDKAMFRPGYVFLYVSLTIPTDEDGNLLKPSSSIQSVINECFFSKITFLDLIGISSDAVSAAGASMSNVVYLARNYYFQGYEVSALSETEYLLTLKCYSIDRKLSLSKYSKVHTGETLANEILKAGVASHLSSLKSALDDIVANETNYLQNRIDDGQIDKASIPETDKIYFNTNDSLGNINFANLLLTGYKEERNDNKVTSAKRTENSNATELKHPYLVQYNESFYDFIARETHKCGEFFYYENGRITVGLPYSTRERIFNPKTRQKSKYDNEILPLSGLCSFSSVVTEESEATVFGGVLSVNSDYANRKAISIEDSKNYYSSDYTSDEALHVVTKKDDRYGTSHSCALYGDVWWMVYKTLGTYFKTGGPIAMSIGNAIAYIAWELINLGVVIPYLSLDKDYDGKYLSDGKNTKEVNDLGEDADVSILGPDIIANLCNNHFHRVESWERTSAETLVKVNLQSVLKNTHLGETVCLENMDGAPWCVVVSMHGDYSCTSCTNSLEAIPINILSAQTGSLPAVAVPVAGQVEHIRKVSSMEAVVSDASDPLRLGRVRVRYPWQSSGSGQSPWLRVQVPFAGGTSDNSPGFCMTPSVGEHVMLGYVNGNVEYPFVSGSLYYLSTEDSLDHIPPMGDFNSMSMYFKTNYPIRTIASGKGHALVFQDLLDTDLISQAIPFAGTIINVLKLYAGPEFIKAWTGVAPIRGGSVILRDASGITTVSLNPSMRAVNIESSLGSVTMSAFTGITINAPNGDVSIKGKNISLLAGNNITLQAGANIDRKNKVVSDTVATILGQVAAKAAVSIVMETAGINLGGIFDLSFLRSFIETFLRPVEGTLSLRSKRNVVMTANNGNVTIPASMMSSVKTWDPSKKDKKTVEYSKYQDLPKNKDSVNGKVVKQFLEKANSEVDRFYKRYRDALNSLSEVLKDLNALCSKLKDDELLRSLKKKDLANKLETPKAFFDYAKEKRSNVKLDELFSEKDLACAIYLTSLNWAIKKIHSNYWVLKSHPSSSFLKDCVSYDNSAYPIAVLNKLEGDDKETIKSSIKHNLEYKWEVMDQGLFSDKFSDSFFNGDNVSTSLNIDGDVTRQIMLVKKFIAVQTVLGFSEVKIKKLEDAKAKTNSGGFITSFDATLQKFVKGESDWCTFVKLIVPAQMPNDSSTTNFLKNLGNGALAVLGGNPAMNFDKLTNRGGAAGPRAYSDPGGTGSILMSIEPGHYIQYSDKQWVPHENSNLILVSEYLYGIDKPNA